MLFSNGVTLGNISGIYIFIHSRVLERIKSHSKIKVMKKLKLNPLREHSIGNIIC